MQKLKIGELAVRTGCQVETIRFYEKEGLLPVPPRSAGNYRLYGDAHVARLTFIRHCRSMDMTLDEIRILLQFQDEPDGECSAVNALLDAHIRHVATRIRELRELERQLFELRRRRDVVRSARQCAILNELTEPGRVASNQLTDAAYSSGVHRVCVQEGKDI